METLHSLVLGLSLGGTREPNKPNANSLKCKLKIIRFYLQPNLLKKIIFTLKYFFF